MRRLILLALFLATVGVGSVAVRAAVDSTLTVSLLTCSPGEETYELYGHTALLVRSDSARLRMPGFRGTYREVVFNYGTFSFEQPHFVWRFVLGQTDYMLSPCRLEDFLYSYYERGSWVQEQLLNLSTAEANMLADSLMWYSQPDHSVYRYSIFRNNCTTKARDIVEHCIRGRVIYPARPRRNTFRSIIHEFTHGHEWADVGNDLLLGADVDTLLTERDEMFAPLYMMHYADSAMILTGYDSYRPLVRTSTTLLEGRPEKRREVLLQMSSFPVSPRVCAWLLFGLCLAMTAVEWHRRRVCWQLDLALMALQGLTGVLLMFMALCSEHPGVATNWQLMLYHPVPLLCLYTVVRTERRGQLSGYHYFALLMVVAFMAMASFLPQDFPDITLPLALTLLSRPVSNIVVNRARKA